MDIRMGNGDVVSHQPAQQLDNSTEWWSAPACLCEDDHRFDSCACKSTAGQCGHRTRPDDMNICL